MVSKSMLLKGKKIYTSNGEINGGILIEEGRIKEILTGDKLTICPAENVIDVKDNTIIPGLIDIHVHGGGGFTAGSSDISEVYGMAGYIASRGVTSYQPSTAGGLLSDIIKSLETLKIAIQNKDYSGARMLGIHMEGPFLNAEKKGAFNPELLLKPSVKLVKDFIQASGNTVTHLTLAPELEGADEVIQYLVENNILASGGHTNATLAETKKAIDLGIRLSNHTCNAQRSILHREPGALGAYLLDDRVDCELICDRFHVHPDMMRIVIKMKSINKICMISDSVAAAGIDPGEYFLLGHKVTVDKDGWSKLADGTIAGSTKDLMYGLKGMVKNIGFSMEDALIMASLNPARVSGFGKQKGSIEVGKDADLTVIDDDFNVKYTFVEGRMVYDSSLGKDYKNKSLDSYRVDKIKGGC